MTLRRNRIVAGVVSQDEVLLEQGGPILPYDWCPYEKGKFDTAHTETTLGT